MHTLAPKVVHQPSADFHPGPKQFGTVLSAFRRSRQSTRREQRRPSTGVIVSGLCYFIQLKTKGFKHALTV